MKIAIVAGAFPALSETFVLNQVTGLLDRGHDVRVFAEEARQDARTHEDVARYDLLSRTTYWPSGVGAMLRLARSPRKLARAVASRNADVALGATYVGEFDAILCHFGHVGERVRALRDAGVIDGPLAVIFHAYDVTVLLREQGEDYYERLFDQAELLLPISEAWRARLIELGAPADRIAVHHMGIDTTRFEFAPRDRAPDEPTRLVTIARLVEKKGISDAIQAVAAARRRFGTRLELDIVGDGPLRGELEALAQRCEVDDVVRFLGWRTQDEIAATLQESHILIQPSVTAANGDMEGIPVGIMEAMASGMPVVSTYHSGIPELVEDRVSGRLVPERDAGALAVALRELADDPGQWAALGAAGRAKVVAEFDVDTLNDKLQLRLQSLAESR